MERACRPAFGMGVVVVAMIFVDEHAARLRPADRGRPPLAGFFVVPMNALLQHRGYVLLSGRPFDLAVQNFNENISILLMLAIYCRDDQGGFPHHTIIVASVTFVEHPGGSRCSR